MSLWTFCQQTDATDGMPSLEQTRRWYWLPGWSFRASVFLPLIEALPGEHWIGDYQSALTSQPDCDFHSMAQLLADEFPEDARSDNTFIVGWSLGGALAMATKGAMATRAAIARSCSVITLATGQTFTHPDGMSQQVFEQFCQRFVDSPDKTLSRFHALITQSGSRSQAGQLIRQLREHTAAASPLSPSDQQGLRRTLEWLNYEALPEADLAMFGTEDALLPSTESEPLANVRTSGQTVDLSGSHAFFLEPDNLAAVIHQLANFADHTGSLNQEADS
ncbi:MAG: alpha/beta fold hydrolase [Pseudomonadota bacterium]|nr:alpha/beta fold hydrolase [Pseudomonadota bacterium]